jgi:hypothetical protein
MHTNFWSENLQGRNNAEDGGVDEKIILERILGENSGKLWTGFIWLRTGTSGGSCEHENEPSVSTKGRKFLVCRSNYWLL